MEGAVRRVDELGCQRLEDCLRDSGALAVGPEVHEGGATAMLGRIDPAGRALLELWSRHGMSDQQLGDFLGVAPEDIARRRWRVIRELRQELSADATPRSPLPVVAGTGEVPAAHRQAEAARDTTDLHGPRFKLIVVALMSISVAALYLLQAVLWEGGKHPESWQRLVQSLSFLWPLPLLTGGISVIGMLLQRQSPRVEPGQARLSNLVSFRYVSRGTNQETLRHAIESVRREMAKLPAFPYVIEAVIEQDIDLGEGQDLTKLVVPRDYTTASGSLYKARALQYGLEQSPIRDDAWILHCDEESHVHDSLIRGIYQAIVEEEASGEHRIGQGAILYYHSLDEHPFLTLADSIRTGDDIGRFHLQNRKLGIPVWGFHGSFILVRNSVEKDVDFDFGPAGSITEDAFWALCQAERGRKSRWVDGYMIEQAPERIIDFLKQRRRWFVGVGKCVTSAPVPFRYRAPLTFFMVVWSFSWLAILYTYLNLFTGYYTHPAVQALGNVSFASFLTIYLVGLRANLRVRGVGKPKALRLYVMQVLCLPLFSTLEGISVLYGIIKPETSFHVIQKHQTGHMGQATAAEPSSSARTGALAGARAGAQPSSAPQQ